MDEIKAVPDSEPAPESELAWAGRILGYVIIGCLIVICIVLTLWVVHRLIAHW